MPIVLVMVTTFSSMQRASVRPVVEVQIFNELHKVSAAQELAY